MNKPDGITQDVWDAAILYSGVYAEPAGETLTDLRMDFARAIMAAKAEERERIKALLAHGAPHSPRRYIYDAMPDRRIWACDKLDESIDS